MKSEDRLLESVNAFFSKVKMDGIKAIAHSTTEQSRMELLGLMEFIDNQEAEFKALLKEISSTTVVYLKEGEEFTEAMLAQMPKEFRVEKLDEDGTDK